MPHKTQPDYTRICADCLFHTPNPIADMCNLPRNLVTGRQYEVTCAAARSKSGHCGPAGKNWRAIDPMTTVPNVAAVSDGRIAVKAMRPARKIKAA